VHREMGGMMHYSGHISPVTAVCVTPSGCLASGDCIGTVSIWQGHESSTSSASSCLMLDPSPSYFPVACIANAPEEDADVFAVGFREGTACLATCEGRIKGVWSAGAGDCTILTVTVSGLGNEIVLVGPNSVFSAKVKSTGMRKIATFPHFCCAACFEGRMVIACGTAAVTIMTLNGHIRACVNMSDACAATFLKEDQKRTHGVASLEKSHSQFPAL